MGRGTCVSEKNVPYTTGALEIRKMPLNDVIQKLQPDQKKYLVALAICKRQTPACIRSGISCIQVDEWESDPLFTDAIREIRAKDYTMEAVRIWAGNHLEVYLSNIHMLAKDAKSEKIKMEACKYLIALAGGEQQKTVEQSLMEKYVLGGDGSKETKETIKTLKIKEGG